MDGTHVTCNLGESTSFVFMVSCLTSLEQLHWEVWKLLWTYVNVYRESFAADVQQMRRKGVDGLAQNN